MSSPSVKNSTFGLTLLVTPALVLGMLATLAAPTLAGDKPHKKVCIDNGNRLACQADVVTDTFGNAATSSSPVGFTPAQIRKAYGLTTASTTYGANQTIGVVTAYRHPYVAKDLSTFNSKFSLGTFSTCSSKLLTGCFQEVNQNGLTTSWPASNASWALETDLDVQWAHAVCPKCKLLLVDASSNSITDLTTAVATAVRLGATVVNNSYGGAEMSSTFNGVYDQPNVVMVAAAGDVGYGAESPASLPSVVAVGGTTLRLNTADNSWLSETVWSGTGSGCSAYWAAPPWQPGTAGFDATGCGSQRSMADVAAVADPSTGVPVYDSLAYNGKTGWFTVGGTSLSAPIISAIYALAQSSRGCVGKCASPTYPGQLPYGHADLLHDVTVGSNGTCASTACSGGPGYDGPTGMGTPTGINAFKP